MLTAHVVFNPASGSYSPSRQARILSALQSAGITPLPLLPASEAEAIAAVRALCVAEEQPLIVAVGGDGTVNTVINGMLEQRATLGVIPLGTANVLACELGIRSLDDAVKRMASGRRRLFSVGEATSAAGIRRFLLMAGIGIDGAVVAGVREREKRRLGKLAYVLSGVREIWRWDRTELTVSDGRRTITCHSVVVANASHYGGPFVIAPQAALFSPRLDIVPLQLPTRRRFVRTVLSLLLRGETPAVDGWQVGVDQLTITGTRPVQLDGDVFGAGPLKIRLLPDFNTLLC
jgi:diacylglycerol kinase family enzyme